MLRLILIVLALFIFFIPIGLPAMLVCWLLGLVSPDAQTKASMAYLRFLMKLALLLSGSKVTAVGAENIPETEPVLFVCNHRSYFDIFVQY